jgi:predicted RNA methylase
MISRKIPDDVLRIMSMATVMGNVVVLNSGQLERDMYLKVNKVLEAMGGKWNRKEKGHVFNGDPVEKIESILLTGEYNMPADMGFYETPVEVVEMMIRHAKLDYGTRVLEPSAGMGAIARVVAQFVGKENVYCCELDTDRWVYLFNMGFVSGSRDFLKMEPATLFDRVIMNPPFSRQQDIDHVTHALKFLKPGGILVSIMGSGITFRENKKTVEFRNLLGRLDSNIIPLPSGSFKVSGTMVNTVMVVARL